MVIPFPRVKYIKHKNNFLTFCLWIFEKELMENMIFGSYTMGDIQRIGNKFLKQHASRFMLIFIKILKMYLNVWYCEIIKKEATYTLSMALTTHINYQKVIK
jgi:hypothetical protein